MEKKRTLLDYFSAPSKKLKTENEDESNKENKENKDWDRQFKLNDPFRLKSPLDWQELHRYEWIRKLLEYQMGKQHPQQQKEEEEEEKQEKQQQQQEQPKQPCLYLLPKDCVLVYVRNFYDEEYCKKMMEELETLKVKEGLVYEAKTPRASLWMSGIL
jgi:hypothetical protein